MDFKYLNFLDFIVKELYNLPNGEQISRLYEKYSQLTGFKIDDNELDNFIEQNDGKYYYIIGNPDLAEITEKGKQIIYTYGSLSEFLQYEIQLKQKAQKRQNWKIISPIVISGLMLIVSIYFGISNNKKDKTIDDLNIKINDLEKVIVQKDSIINNLKIKYDTTLKDSISEIYDLKEIKTGCNKEHISERDSVVRQLRPDSYRDSFRSSVS